MFGSSFDTMEILIKEEDCIKYLIEFEDGDFEYSATFKVLRVTSWDVGNGNVCDTKHYINGYIKASGCSHFWFGNEDGYLHLCGKEYFEEHKKVMDTIWDVCSQKIKLWHAKND